MVFESWSADRPNSPSHQEISILARHLLQISLALVNTRLVDGVLDEPGRHAGFALQLHEPVWSREHVAGKDWTR